MKTWSAPYQVTHGTKLLLTTELLGERNPSYPLSYSNSAAFHSERTKYFIRAKQTVLSIIIFIKPLIILASYRTCRTTVHGSVVCTTADQDWQLSQKRLQQPVLYEYRVLSISKWQSKYQAEFMYVPWCTSHTESTPITVNFSSVPKMECALFNPERNILMLREDIWSQLHLSFLFFQYKSLRGNLSVSPSRGSLSGLWTRTHVVNLCLWSGWRTA